MLNSTIARITHPACEISVVELPWEQYIANGLEYHHTILVVKGIYLPFSVQGHHDPVGVPGRHHYALCKSPLTYASTNSMNIRVFLEANAMGEETLAYQIPLQTLSSSLISPDVLGYLFVMKRWPYRALL